MESSECSTEETLQAKPPCVVCRRETFPRVNIRKELLNRLYFVFSIKRLKAEYRFICTNCIATVEEINDAIVFGMKSIKDTINNVPPDPDMKLPNLFYFFSNETYKSDYKSESKAKIISPEATKTNELKAPAVVSTRVLRPIPPPKPIVSSPAERLALSEPEPDFTVIRCDCHQRGFRTRSALAAHERSVRRHKIQLKRTRRIRNRSPSVIEYPCIECDMAFSTRYTLKKHNSRMHSAKLVCRLCEKAEFYNNMDREFHEATCPERFLNNSNSSVQTRSRSRLGRISRSQSMIDLNESLTDTSLFHDSDVTSCLSERRSRSRRRRGRPSKTSMSQIVSHLQCNKPEMAPSLDRSHIYESGESILAPVPWRVNSQQDLSQILLDYSTLSKPNKRLQCTECDYHTSNVDILCRHEIRKHNKNPWFSCKECHAAYNNMNQLEFHRETRHYSGPFLCNRCTDCFASQRELQTHFKFHKKDFLCHVCDLRFVDQMAFAEHWRYTKDTCHLTEKNIRVLQSTDNRSRSPSVESNSSYGITISEVTSLSSDSRCSSPTSTEMSSRSGTPFPDNEMDSFISERSSTPFPMYVEDDEDDEELMYLQNNDTEMPEYDSVEVITFDDHCFRMLTNIDNGTHDHHSS